MQSMPLPPLMPAEQRCQQESWATLRQAIATLPPTHQLVLQRIDIEGYSYVEVATELALPLSTVKSSLFRARALVRDALVAAGMIAAPLETAS